MGAFGRDVSGELSDEIGDWEEREVLFEIAVVAGVEQHFAALLLQEQGDEAPPEDFGHVLEVSKGDMAESPLRAEATFGDDSVHVGMKSQRLF